MVQQRTLELANMVNVFGVPSLCMRHLYVCVSACMLLVRHAVRVVKRSSPGRGIIMPGAHMPTARSDTSGDKTQVAEDE